MKVIKDNCYKGTRILVGNEKRALINQMVDDLVLRGYEEISIPIIHQSAVFINGKVGEENQKMMYTLRDEGGRFLALAPEYTAIMQGLTWNHFKHNEDVKLFYVQECFRGEKPQAGRYRQFTQLGVEVLNPTQDHTEELIRTALNLIHRYMGYDISLSDFEVTRDVTRGLDYYLEGKGFEIACNRLGAQKQVCGGGSYEGGIGFAIGIDRLLLLTQKGTEENEQP